MSEIDNMAHLLSILIPVALMIAAAGPALVCGVADLIEFIQERRRS